MQTSQGSYILNNSGTQLRATTRTIPNNSYPQQEGRVNTISQYGETFIKKASDKI
jgi:hypothetical protein